jgi:hypothetical protein
VVFTHNGVLLKVAFCLYFETIEKPKPCNLIFFALEDTGNDLKNNSMMPFYTELLSFLAPVNFLI